MTLSEEFSQQWKSLSNYLLSEMMSGSQQSETIRLDRIEQLLATEKKKWSLPGQYQNAWLEKFRRTDSAAAAAFEQALADVKLEQVRPADRPSSALMVGPAVGGVVLGFGVPQLLQASTLITAAGTVGLGALGAVLGMGIVKQKRYDALSRDCDAYKDQLEAAGRKLADIVKRADS